jgi:hypothetical protein
VARLLSRFRDAFSHDDLQAIALQGMALLPRLPRLLVELTRVLGTSLVFISISTCSLLLPSLSLSLPSG